MSRRIPGMRGGCREAAPLSPEEQFQVLSAKYNQLADAVMTYMSEADLERGIRNRNANALVGLVARIVGGVPTTQGAYPECCLIGQRHPNGFQDWFCTGVLIADSMVLTAGHCIEPSSSIPYVVALSALDHNQLVNAEIIQVKKAVVHPDYLSMRTNDISALVLSQGAATPPRPMATPQQTNSGYRTTLVGFGNDDYASTRGFGIQRQVSVDIVAIKRNSSDDLSQEELQYGFESDYEFVAGGGGYDSCNGDSGGPAYIEDGPWRAVAGLTSRGTNTSSRPCGDGGIYTRVDSHKDFIVDVAMRYGVTL